MSSVFMEDLEPKALQAAPALYRPTLLRHKVEHLLEITKSGNSSQHHRQHGQRTIHPRRRNQPHQGIPGHEPSPQRRRITNPLTQKCTPSGPQNTNFPWSELFRTGPAPLPTMRTDRRREEQAKQEEEERGNETKTEREP